MLSVATNLSYCWRYYRNHSSYSSIYIKTLSIQGPTPLNNEYSTYMLGGDFTARPDDPAIYFNSSS